MENMKNPQEIVKKALPSTVLLEMEYSNGRQHGFGSGFFIQKNKIATNFHVVEGAHKGSAKLFDQNERYDIAGYTALDVNNDLIILKIKTSVDTPELPLGNSDDVHTGDIIYAVGNPVGLEGTISDGIISGIRDGEPSQNHSYKRIQITAPISPGSSGGAVLNTKGEVVGVSVSGMRSLQPISLHNPQDAQYINVAQNLNFAIPSNSLKTLLQESDERDSITSLSKAKLERVKSLTNKLGWIGSASYTFALQNRSSMNVKNVHCEVTFKDKESNVIEIDTVVFPWLIPARRSKTVVRLSTYDTTGLVLVTPPIIQLLEELEVVEYYESDISDSAIESFLVGLADLLLTNMGHADYSSVKPHIKRLTEDYEIRIIDLEVVN